MKNSRCRVEAGNTYRVLTNVSWSFLVTHGEVSHIFEMRVQP